MNRTTSRPSIAILLAMTVAAAALAGCSEPPRGEAPDARPEVGIPTPELEIGPLPKPPSSQALAAALEAYLDEVDAVAESAPREGEWAEYRFVWLGQGEWHALAARALLAENLSSESIRSALLARWYFSVVVELEGREASELPAMREELRLDERVDEARTAIDALRGAVDAEGLAILVLAQLTYAKALDDLEGFSAALARAEDKPHFAETVGENALLVDADLRMVEALVAAARTRAGAVRVGWDPTELLEEARRTAAAIPLDEELEGAPRSAYYQARHRFPARMDVLAAHGWPEGAATLALDTLLYAATHARFAADENVTQEEVAAAVTVLHEEARSPLDLRDTHRALNALREAAADPDNLALAVEAAHLAPRRASVHAALVGCPDAAGCA
jgi:hypothetical protein